MSFWPTSDELRAGVRWIKRHPYLSGGLAAVAVGSALWYWLSEEDEEQLPKLPRQADLQPATGPGSDAGIRTTNPAGSNRKNVSVTSTPSVPVKRSVGWVDANGGELETRLPVRVDRSDSTGSIGMTLDASVDTPCTVSAPLAAVSAADVEQCSAVNDQSSISTSSTHASSQDSIDSAVIKGSSAPSSPRVPTIEAVLTTSPIVTGQSVRSPSPLAVLQSQGFSGTSASGIGVVPDLLATPVNRAVGSVVITSGMATPEDQQAGEGDWGHFMTPQVIPNGGEDRPIPGQASDEKDGSVDGHQHRSRHHRGKRGGQHHKNLSHK